MAFRSSGNLTADRRFAYGMAARDDGDWITAEEMIRQALELASHWASGWFALGETLLAAGKTTEALTAFSECLTLEPEDSHGASLKLARLRGETIAMPQAYVAGLFNDYATKFEKSLRQSLHYNGPELLLDRLHILRPQTRFDLCLDLGCGTGLAAEIFRPLVTRFSGVDISAEMVKQAKAKQLYADLAVDDLAPWLHAQPKATADLALAADVFVYVKELSPVFAALSPALRSGALFAFTFQSHGGADVILGDDMRYAHAPQKVEAQLAESGFRICHSEDSPCRFDRGTPVPGHLLLAEKI